MIRHAAQHGAREIIVGLGGSATNDGGFGMARALGYRFFSETSELVDGPEELIALTKIVPPDEMRLPQILAAVDVRNPLLGDRGATRVFGPQKGASPDQLKLLERALATLSQVVARDLGVDFRDAPGAGAAGGLGFGLMSFCGAKMRWGFDIVAEAIQLRDKIRGADVVITGEGRLDAQTLEGKGPARVAEIARESNKPVFAIVGEADEAGAAMFTRVLPLVRGSVDRTTAIERASELIRERARELAHSYFASEKAN